MDLAPARATIVEGEQEKIVPVDVLKPGDIIAVRPGERIPADGKIIAGTTSIDEAAVSGESIPVAKGAGDKVISATLNKNGYFRYSNDTFHLSENQDNDNNTNNYDNLTYKIQGDIIITSIEKGNIEISY